MNCEETGTEVADDAQDIAVDVLIYSLRARLGTASLSAAGDGPPVP